MLLLHGANPSKRRNDGKSALGLAAEYGRPAALGTFFRHDINLLESRDASGRTPMLSAITSRHTPTVKYMLGRWRADPFVTDADGNNALHVCRGGVEILLLLLHGRRAPQPGHVTSSPGSVLYVTVLGVTALGLGHRPGGRDQAPYQACCCPRHTERRRPTFCSTTTPARHPPRRWRPPARRGSRSCWWRLPRR